MWSLLFDFLGNGACVRAVALVACMLATGCQIPQWRVFQSKAPEPLQKPAIQVEAERQSADWLAKTVSAPPEAIPVAQKLSVSLGEPEHPIEARMPAIGRNEAVEALAAGIIADQNGRKKLNEKLAKYDGKKIEGTGFNIFGPSLSLPVIVIIGLLIFCPSIAIPILTAAWKGTRAALATTVKGIQEFKSSHPEAAESINTHLDRAQDVKHKELVKKIKAKL